MQRYDFFIIPTNFFWPKSIIPTIFFWNKSIIPTNFLWPNSIIPTNFLKKPKGVSAIFIGGFSTLNDRKSNETSNTFLSWRKQIYERLYYFFSYRKKIRIFAKDIIIESFSQQTHSHTTSTKNHHLAHLLFSRKYHPTDHHILTSGISGVLPAD